MFTMRSLIFLASYHLACGQTSLTIYNGGFASVKEDLRVGLDRGVTDFSYTKATAQVVADSVILKPIGDGLSFNVLEQSYRNDPVTEGALLRQYEGRVIDFEITREDGTTFRREGQVIRSGYEPGGRHQTPIVKIDGEMMFRLPGLPVFPILRSKASLRPSLNWKLRAKDAGEAKGRLSYLTRGLSWETTYSLVVVDDETLALSSWVTLTNRSGTDFEDAKVKLVAGDVRMESGVEAGGRDILPALGSSDEVVRSYSAGRSFQGVYLYTLPDLLDLQNNETKQVGFLGSSKIAAEKKYQVNFFSSHSGPAPVKQYWVFENTKENGLGGALPGGKVRLFAKDPEDGQLEFNGEDGISHTAQEEEVRIEIGSAFDLIAESEVLSEKRSEEGVTRTIEITLRNRTFKEVMIEGSQLLSDGRRSRIISKSPEMGEPKGGVITFEAEVPAEGEVKLQWVEMVRDRARQE